MVRTTLKRVAKIFRPEDKQSNEDKPTLNRRLVLIVQFSDATYVLQGEQQIHQKNHCFKTEAMDVFHKVFTFCTREYVQVGKIFQNKHIQWHPIIFDLSFWANSTLLNLEIVNLTGLLCMQIKDHPLLEQLKEYDKRPSKL